jgi:hypothetical protein
MYRRIRDNFPVAIKKIAKAKIASLYHGVPLEVLLLQKVTVPRARTLLKETISQGFWATVFFSFSYSIDP